MNDANFRAPQKCLLQLRVLQYLLDMEGWKQELEQLSLFKRSFVRDKLIEPKLHVEKRNVKVGDVVMIQDSDAFRGNYRMGIVKETFPRKTDEVCELGTKTSILAQSTQAPGLPISIDQYVNS